MRKRSATSSPVGADELRHRLKIQKKKDVQST
jgi:hypothetical protein